LWHFYLSSAGDIQLGNLGSAAPDQCLLHIMMIDSVVTSGLLLAISAWVIFEGGWWRKIFCVGGDGLFCIRH